MVNFNTKKRILRKLSDTAEKHFLMLVPCLIAAAFVKLYYFILCNIDIAFSDKDGNFLGIKHKEKPPKAEKRKKDDIVYVKRPVLSRVVSAVLAFAFAGMFVPEVLPEIEIFAADATPNYISIDDENSPFGNAIVKGNAADKSDYYLDANNTVPFNNPEIYDETSSYKPKNAYGAFEFTLKTYSLPNSVKNSDGSVNGGFYKAVILYDEMDAQGSTIAEGKVWNQSLYYGNNVAVSSTNTLAKVTSCTVTGLDPSHKYKFYVGVYETILLYQINKGDDIKDYINPNTGKIRTESTGNKDDKYATVVAYNEWAAVSNKVEADPAQWLSEPNPTPADDTMTIQYVSTAGKVGNQITVSSKLASNTDVTSYNIWKKKDGGKYSIIATKAVNNWSSGDWVFTDELVDDTSKYYYILTAYTEKFPLVRSSGYATVTSSLPSGATSNGYDEYVFTKTAKPQNLTVVSNNTYNTITWSAVEGATRYRISRVDESGNEESLDARLTSTTYQDKTISLGMSYTYKVVAINDNNDEGTHDGNGAKESEAAEQWIEAITPSVDEPFNVEATSSDNETMINISWQCYTEDVTGFDIKIEEVVYDDEGNETGTKDCDIKENIKASTVLVKTAKDSNGRTVSYYSTTYSGCEYDKSYRISVRSYLIVGTTGEKKPISNYHPRPKGYLVKVGTEILPPQEISAASASKQITVTWSASKGATSYILNVYKMKNGKVSETYKYTTTDTSYTLTGLTDGDVYQFTVQAVKKVLGETVESDPSVTVSAIVGTYLTKPVDLTVTQSGDNVVITWRAVDGASGYYLYIVNTSTNSTDLKDITATTYTQTDAKYGVTYQYYVKAYKTIEFDNGTKPLYYESERSDIESLTVGGSIGFPSNVKATAAEGQITLTWDAVAGAEGYMIYATCDGKTDTFNVTSSPFVHTGLTAGKKYSYYIVAYKTVSNTTVYSSPSVTVSATVGGVISAPVDFTVTTTESTAVLKWTAVTGAEGYTVYGKSDGGQTLEIDVSKPTYTHTGLISGDTWTYYVKAYKTVSGERVYSSATNSIAVKIGATLAAPTDLVATAGNRQVDLKWTAVTGAAGYIVYVYDDSTSTFQPVTIVSKPTYSHTSLTNGKKYTYMVAAYKISDGERIIGNYSLSVSAIPTAGNAADVDTTIGIKGTAPYGISHSELISAAANHDAFDDPVDAYITVNDESTSAVKEVLRGYANGLSSFISYPFDITLYLENTLVEVEPNDGFNVTFTIPVPDQMINYRDYITVIHLKDDGTDEVTEDSDYSAIFVSGTDLEVLPSAIVDVGGVWCVQFTTASCSPFAFVIYKDNLNDVSSGGASSAEGGFTGNYDTSVLLFTALPDILPMEKKTKFVAAEKKRYRIKARTLK